MKKILLLFSLIILLVGCNNAAVEKPKNLLDKEEMTSIIYDLTILDAMRSRNPAEAQKMQSRDYIYKKYNIDSLGFAQNNQYYASDIAAYKKIYEKVNERIDKEKKAADSIVKKSGGKATTADSDLPQVQ